MAFPHPDRRRAGRARSATAAPAAAGPAAIAVASRRAAVAVADGRAAAFAAAVAAALAAVTLSSFVAIPVQAQTSIPYKVTGPDGKVTYTDRPVMTDGRVTAVVNRAGGAGQDGSNSNPPLPLELRQPAARYPVTLYVVEPDCEPCAAARQLLRQRGIPYSERQVLNDEDSQALERLSGSREAPTLAIGSQILRGLAPEVWASYLDAAGYPRDSRLPAGYQYPPATPLIARAPAKPASPPPPPVSDDNGPTLPNLPNAAGIRF